MSSPRQLALREALKDKASISSTEISDATSKAGTVYSPARLRETTLIPRDIGSHRLMRF